MWRTTFSASMLRWRVKRNTAELHAISVDVRNRILEKLAERSELTSTPLEQSQLELADADAVLDELGPPEGYASQLAETEEKTRPRARSRKVSILAVTGHSGLYCLS